MTGFALAGGGAKGAYQVGAYVALVNNGIKPDVIAGTSIGAVNAVLMAQGDIHNLINFWLNTGLEILDLDLKLTKKIKSKDFTLEDLKYDFGQIKKILQNKGIDTSKFVEALGKGINEEKLRRSKIKFGLVTVKIKNKKFMPLELSISDIPEGKVAEYVLASSYWPLFSYKKIIDNEFYLDGGFYSNTPISLVEKSGCDTIYAIKIGGIGFENKRINNNTKIIEISPSKSLGSLLFVDKEKNIRNMKIGYLDTLKIINKLDGYDFYFNIRNEVYYNYLVRNIDNKLLKRLNLKFKAIDNKDLIIKCVEFLMKKNEYYDLEIYNLKKVIRKLNKNNIYTRNKSLIEFIYKIG